MLKLLNSFFLISFLLLSACRPSIKPPGWIDEERLLNADNEPANWMSLGWTYQQQHYSPLDKINAENIKELGLAWEYDASSRRGRIQRGLEACPIVVDGVLYTSGAWGVVYALDAKTGKEIWRYDPDVDGNYARRACCDVVNRGVQVWKGKVYVGVLDGYLVCIDAATGIVVWKVDAIIDRERFYTITGPPQVAGNVVVIGNSGAEFGVRGYITAYDLETGKQAWRFFTVPGDPKKDFEHPELEAASKTWDPNSNWESGMGGTVWGEMTYDPELNLLYVGTGNSSPYPIWFRSPTGGDNLYLSSILAINPDNGKLKWYYQTTPGEIWDYTATEAKILADLNISGKKRKVIMQDPKNGFFYVLDRKTGEFISAEKYTTVNWASHIDKKTGRPVLTGEGWYKDEPKLVYPFLGGGHNWQPMSFNPKTGLIYIPAMDIGFIYVSNKDFTYNRDDNSGIDYFPVLEGTNYGGIKPKEAGRLVAWDPVKQKEIWRVNMKVPDANGGVLSTGSNLVFQGTTDGYFVVYNAKTGEKLKEIETGTGIMAGPVTYMVDGEQYVAVMAGFGGAELPFPPKDAAFWKYENKGRILAFKLGGTKVPIPAAKEKITMQDPPQKKLSADLIQKGELQYRKLCIFCHGGFGKEHISAYPDLANMSKNIHDQFREILLKGTLRSYGMADFADILNENDVEAIHQFLINMQQKIYSDSTTKWLH